ncbi:hypothetical protein K493DRAFT_299071 [Basidiobolus meristosporus CBS 931.73]|uniref:PX domain-containing protein n=1 Tax=Basidiobolus meristosporus CBS 931.73 TaxID=1314790 RepID=A0A1Y1YPY1_9FUNG|nr:hypothetical protein K493DRAFT_299071 [Basidiobolus meristosporus CBS 931.73]|eukprot:ORY00082.1 hypothetical protein K493DRAFT_299071 [Basidiobolus meristosporus CBS 931.73]
MAVVNITSPIIRHAPLLASAQITGIDIRREACWFVITVIPFPEEKGDYQQLNGSYKIFRRFEHFQYFANYIQVECNSSNCQVPKLKTRKRLLFSKLLYAERRKEDLNVFLMKVFQLPLKVKSSLCFAEFLGIWKGDLKENGLDETFTPKIDYLGRELSSEANKITAAPVAPGDNFDQNFDLLTQRPHVRNHPHKQRYHERKKHTAEPLDKPKPRADLKRNSMEKTVLSDAAVQRAKTCLANSLQSHYTMSTPWNNLKKTPSLKVAPWNIRHLTPKEMLALEDKRQSLVRSHTYTLGVRRSMHFVSPFIRVKVILNAEHIINFLVPRYIQLDELRQRVFGKFNNSGITDYDREEMIVLCYKRDNKVVIVATNEDLRKIIVNDTDKFTFYLASNNLLEEFFWMREVIEMQETLLKRHSTQHSKQPSGEQGKSSQQRKSQELQRASSRRQTALVSLQRQNTLANFRKTGLTSSTATNHNRNSFSVKTRSSTGSYRARRVRHTDRQYKKKSKEKSGLSEAVSLVEEPDEYQIDQPIYEITLDAESSMHLNIRPNIHYNDLHQLVVKEARLSNNSFERRLTYRTSDAELVHLASKEELAKLFTTLAHDDDGERLVATKQTLYLLPSNLFARLQQETVP